jgi:hypothetical protein
MKNQRIKISTIQLLGIVILCLTAGFTNAQTTDFTGAWKLNVSKTKTPGVGPNSITEILKINQNSKQVTINKIAKAGDDEKTGYVETLKFDGSPTETTTPSKLKRTATVQWSADHKSFTETYSSKDDQGNVKQNGTLIFSLVNEKELKILAKLTYGERTFELDETYDKQ